MVRLVGVRPKAAASSRGPPARRQLSCSAAARPVLISKPGRDDPRIRTPLSARTARRAAGLSPARAAGRRHAWPVHGPASLPVGLLCAHNSAQVLRTQGACCALYACTVCKHAWPSRRPIILSARNSHACARAYTRLHVTSFNITYRM